MNAENTNYLIKTYPKLYNQINLPLSRSCMCWGFECGDGWFEIINNLSKKIENKNNKNSEPYIEAVQVKEKFGTLRFYTNFSIDDVDDWIDEAESLSSRTCEICGENGELITNGYYQVLCNKHKNEREKEYDI